MARSIIGDNADNIRGIISVLRQNKSAYRVQEDEKNGNSIGFSFSICHIAEYTVFSKLMKDV
jgi:hypothetical protein